SCSHMIQSGQYVQLTSGDTVVSLAQEFNVTKEIIEAANPASHFAPGEWVFVPTGAGLIGATRFSRVPAQSTHDYLDTGRFLWPVPSSKRISSPFGPRWGRHHDGIDIAGRRGSSVLAADKGVVVYAGRELGGYGNIV